MTNPTRTVAVGKDGKETEILGRDVPLKKHKEHFNASKCGELPKGAVRVEVWERIRQTTGIDVAAQKARLDADKPAKVEAKA